MSQALIPRPTQRMTGALMRWKPARMIGAPADLYGQAQADLATKMQTQLTVGDTANTAGQYVQAITAYVAAGNAGATVIGPEIDLAGYPNVTQPWTQAAWQMNGALATIAATTTPTQTDATSAQTIAYDMLSYYQSAITAGQQAALKDAPGNTTPPGTAKDVGVPLAIAGVVVVGSAAGLLLAAWREGKLGGKKRRR